MKVESLLDLVGNTPLLKVNNIIGNHDLKANLYVKLEMFNVSGSVKMRIVKAIIMDGIKRGLIKKDTTILEASSGNVGIALACLCASLKLKLIIAMPESASIERRALIKAYGAKLILTPAQLGMDGAIQEVNKIANGDNNVFVVSQFTNLINPLTHQFTTAVEMYDDLEGKVDMVVCGIGSGGTITGIGNYLHMVGDTIIVGVEPSESPLISEGKCDQHKIDGIGANFIPEVLDMSVVDKIETISYETGIKGIKMLAEEEGIFVGISSGAAFMCGYEEALKPYNYDKNIVVIIPDSGERYISKIEKEFI